MKKAVYSIHNSTPKKEVVKIPKAPFTTGFKPVKTLKDSNEKKVYILSNGKEYRIGKITSLYNIGNDVDIFEKLSKYNLAPVIFKTDVFNDEKNNEMTYTEMEKLDGTIYDLLTVPLTEKELDIILRLVNELLLRLYKLKISHGDFHWENIGFTYDDKKDCITLKMIDFEFAENKSDFRKEVVQLIRTIDKKYTPLVSDTNRAYISKRLISYYKNNFGEYKDIEEEYKK